MPATNSNSWIGYITIPVRKRPARHTRYASPSFSDAMRRRPSGDAPMHA